MRISSAIWAKPIRPVAPPVAPEPKFTFKPVKLDQKLPMDPKSVRTRRSVFLILLSVPLLVMSSVALYKRVIAGDEKRLQQGEHTPAGGLRVFDKEELRQRDENSWLTRVFGRG